MSRPSVTLTGREVLFADEEIIVSKTDPKGRITYANQVFQRVSGYSERELLGAPHSLIRHPAMPRGVFKLLWDTIEGGRECFAYVINRARSGDHYWVFAHVTPSYDPRTDALVGYHSNRRTADRRAVRAIEPVYAAVRDVEARHASPTAAAAAGAAFVGEFLAKQGVSYDEYVFSL